MPCPSEETRGRARSTNNNNNNNNTIKRSHEHSYCFFYISTLHNYRMTSTSTTRVTKALYNPNCKSTIREKQNTHTHKETPHAPHCAGFRTYQIMAGKTARILHQLPPHQRYISDKETSVHTKTNQHACRNKRKNTLNERQQQKQTKTRALVLVHKPPARLPNDKHEWNKSTLQSHREIEDTAVRRKGKRKKERNKQTNRSCRAPCGHRRHLSRHT
jgi:hypothetical protein